ncbi:hypothetical protein LY78DRAFT_268064 [Colletotrichum sublineola]|nr:hypothetical protein LY78DRAFT_268064 [Colletotrichum sublineola]
MNKNNTLIKTKSRFKRQAIFNKQDTNLATSRDGNYAQYSAGANGQKSPHHKHLRECRAEAAAPRPPSTEWGRHAAGYAAQFSQSSALRGRRRPRNRQRCAPWTPEGDAGAETEATAGDGPLDVFPFEAAQVLHHLPDVDPDRTGQEVMIGEPGAKGPRAAPFSGVLSRNICS